MMELYPRMGRKNVNILDTFKGFSTQDRYMLNDDYATEAVNMDSSVFPAITTRKSIQQRGTVVTSPTWDFNGFRAFTTYTFFRYDASSIKQVTTHELAISNQEIYRYNQATTTWNSIFQYAYLDFFYDYNFSYFQAETDEQQMLFILGISKVEGYKIFLRYNGTSVTLIDETKYPKLSFIGNFTNRMIGANDSTIFVSNSLKYDDWNTPEDTYFNILDTSKGEIITSLLVANGKPLIFKRNALIEMYGETRDTFRPVVVADDIGTFNHKCVTVMDAVVYFLHRTGVYAYAGGRPRRISDAISKVFDDMNLTYTDNYYVRSYEKKLFVNIGTAIYVWDSQYDAWNKWTLIDSKDMVVKSEPKVDDIALFLGVDGLVYRYGTSNTSIPYEWVSKPVYSQTRSQRIRFNHIWITLDIVNGSAGISLNAAPEGIAGWINVGNISGVGLLNYRMAIPTTVVANANYIRIKINGTGTVRIREIVIDYRTLPLR